MEISELKFICNSKNSHKGNSFWIYWSSELYSFGKYIRKYGYYPSFLPLAVYSDHSGPSFSDVPYIHEIETDAPVFLAHRKAKVEKYIKTTNKRAYTLFSPSVFYRQSNNIVQIKDNSGTVCFPVHSLPNSILEFDINQYCKKLKELPKSFHPITVCLHMHDINNETFLKYKENGIGVVSTGNTSDFRFVERLYDIIKKAKYITSNDVSTITFLAIEIRIPFFIYGNKQETINIVDKNFPKGKIPRPKHKQYIFFNEKLALNNNYEIPVYTKEIIFEAESALGLYDGISRKKMFFVLYYALFLWIIKFQWIKWLKNKINK